jgi:hypothetical protein
LASFDFVALRRGSSVDIGYWSDQGVRIHFPADAAHSSGLHKVQTDSGPNPATYTIGTGAVSPWVKLPGREAKHSPPSNAEVKNGGAILPFLHTSLH